MNKITLMIGSLCFLTFSGISAAEIEQKLTLDDVKNAVVEAYGGDKFKSLSSYRVHDIYKGFRRGQSYSPNEIDVVDYQSELFVDLVNQKKDLRWIRGNADGYSIQHQVFDGKHGYSIDYDNDTVSQVPSLNYVNVERRHSYHLDTAMALLLLEPNVSIERLADKRVYGKPHIQLSVKAKNHSTLYLFIEPGSFRITKMVRDHWQPGVQFNFHYNEHSVKSGILYAQSTYVTRGGEPFIAVSQRAFEPSIELSSAFTVPSKSGQQGTAIDMSGMIAKKISKNLYMSGQEWGFSVFYDAGDYFIGAGSYEGISERLAKVQEAFGLNKPLKYQVMSHHHIDHLGGVDELVDLGTILVTAKEHIKAVRKQSKKTIEDKQFLLLDKKVSLVDGEVIILDFPNSHANHNLVTYFADNKVLFTADTYFSREQKGSPQGYDELIDLQSLLQKHKLAPKLYAAAHSSRLLSDKDFEASIKGIVPFEPICPDGWKICPTSD